MCQITSLLYFISLSTAYGSLRHTFLNSLTDVYLITGCRWLLLIVTDNKKRSKTCVKYWTAGRRIKDDSSEFVWKPYISGKFVALNYTDWYQGSPKQPDNKDAEESCMVIDVGWQYHWNDNPCAEKYCICASWITLIRDFIPKNIDSRAAAKNDNFHCEPM